LYIQRVIEEKIKSVLARGKSILLLGPRQTGKTTLIGRLNADLFISLASPMMRQQYERNIELLEQQIRQLAQTLSNTPLVIIDEVQKIPDIMDLAQYLIDQNIAQFILTGSSARKLKRSDNINLLPGRVVYIHMDPLSSTELEQQDTDLNERLLYGSLPEIILQSNDQDRQKDMSRYE